MVSAGLRERARQARRFAAAEMVNFLFKIVENHPNILQRLL
jgi:hypothetical protein